MKFRQKDFSEELKGKIRNTELALKSHVEKLLSSYKPIFAEKNVDFDAGFDREGNDPFQPGYRSSVSIGISENDELIDLHLLKIWECDRYIVGVPTAKNIPGSKIIGELLDEPLEEVKKELKEYIEEVLYNLD
ncbi:hypothetical protein DCC39_08335 [Pueribacillus theae]|uniref:Uncharacterized protein n=1 Tax=Pueribacillus theae TaxID=2171751 RepID=A0A2U1K473_9BACI|nr:hypothetical protein [Pueribacillus theae]PWA11984.1 hypothetical protein DCC39_08335 [Pueribacillus theae]